MVFVHLKKIIFRIKFFSPFKKNQKHFNLCHVDSWSLVVCMLFTIWSVLFQKKKFLNSGFTDAHSQDLPKDNCMNAFIHGFEPICKELALFKDESYSFSFRVSRGSWLMNVRSFKNRSQASLTENIHSCLWLHFEPA